MEGSENPDELDSWEFIPSAYEQQPSSSSTQLREEGQDPDAFVRETSLSLRSGSSASYSASSDSDDQGPELPHTTVQMGRQMRLMIICLSNRIASATSWFWPWSLSSLTAFMAAVAFTFACAKMTRWHKQAMEECKSRLLVLLQEQEEKISKLLVQIVQMNEILSARQKQAMEERKHRLLVLFREQEVKISKILVQIAQMNEFLSARRRVPVLHTC